MIRRPPRSALFPYTTILRSPRLMVQAMEQLQAAGVEPDLWKIEGLDRREDFERIVAAANRDGRAGVGCIILGRGEDRSEEHTSELQSRQYLVCRLLLDTINS